MKYTKEYTDFETKLKKHGKEKRNGYLFYKHNELIKQMKKELNEKIAEFWGEEGLSIVEINQKMIFFIDTQKLITLDVQKIKEIKEKNPTIAKEIDKIEKITKEIAILTTAYYKDTLILALGVNKGRRTKIGEYAKREKLEKEEESQKIRGTYEMAESLTENPLLKIHCKEMKFKLMFQKDKKMLTKEQERREIVFENELYNLRKRKEKERELVIREVAAKMGTIFREKEFSLKYQLMVSEREIKNGTN